jgi:hypothetical protein
MVLKENNQQQPQEIESHYRAARRAVAKQGRYNE